MKNTLLKIEFLDIRRAILDIVDFGAMALTAALLMLFSISIIFIKHEQSIVLICYPILTLIINFIRVYIHDEIKEICDMHEKYIDKLLGEQDDQ